MLRDFDPIKTYVVRNILRTHDEELVLNHLKEFAEISKYHFDYSKPKCESDVSEIKYNSFSLRLLCGG